MILLDLNQVVIANLMQERTLGKEAIDEGLIRHMVVNSIRSYVSKFRGRYGELVICCDNRHYWRKSVFPFYKANRKKDRDDSDLDWKGLFEALNKVRDELKLYFPYRVIDVEGAEADDVIGTMVDRFAPTQDILILSSDKDFVQLQKYPSVTQYSPILKKFISSEDPKAYVIEHIIKGDRGDGIPNFLSGDDVLVRGERQKSISTKKMEEWMVKTPEEFCVTDQMKHGFQRNRQLVDLTYIPVTVRDAINTAYDTAKIGTKATLLNYFMEKRLRRLIENMDEF